MYPPFTQQKMNLLRKLLKISGSQNFIVNLLFWLTVIIIAVVLVLSYRTAILAGIENGCKAAFD